MYEASLRQQTHLLALPSTHLSYIRCAPNPADNRNTSFHCAQSCPSFFKITHSFIVLVPN